MARLLISVVLPVAHHAKGINQTFLSKERTSGRWRTGIIQWAALAGITVLMAEMSASAADKGSMLMKQQLADIAGKEVTVLTLDYAPGALSEPHVHPESVVAYVLEGW